MKKKIVLLSLILTPFLAACGQEKKSVGRTEAPAPAPQTQKPAPTGKEFPVDDGGTGDLPEVIRKDDKKETKEEAKSRRKEQVESEEDAAENDVADHEEIAADEEVPDVEGPVPSLVPPAVPLPKPRNPKGGDAVAGEETGIPVGKHAVPDELSAWHPPALYESPARAWLHYSVDPVLKSIGKMSPRPRVLIKRVKVTMALGYFDGFNKKPLVYEKENYGRHVAVDPFLRSMVHEVLTRECGNDQLQVCGFERRSGDDVEALYVRAGNDGIIQEIRVMSGAYAVYHDLNTGAQAEKQRRRSLKAEALFSRAFEDSDMVVYVGHSRLGGGPDFRPPVLANGDVNYPAYQHERSGARATLRALKNSKRKARTLALLSCDSTDHFLGELRQAGTDMQIATVNRDIMSAENLLASGLASMDLYLRQGHLSGLPRFLSNVPALGPFLRLHSPAVYMAQRHY